MTEESKNKLIELIQLACEESEDFKTKFEYWVIKRKKNPDSEWLLNQLKQALGPNKLEQALYKFRIKIE